MNELQRQLAVARSRPEFMERLQRRVREDKDILDRLREPLARPCQSTTVAVLCLENPTTIGCGLAEGHGGPHRFEIEWL